MKSKSVIRLFLLLSLFPLLLLLIAQMVYLHGDFSIMSGGPCNIESFFQPFATQGQMNKRKESKKTYISAPVEKYIYDNLESLGYNLSNSNVSGCELWNNKTNNPIHDDLHKYLSDLNRYYALVKEFTPLEEDLRTLLKNYYESNPTTTVTSSRANDAVCDLIKLHPGGLKGMFNSSNQLSFTSKSGYIEPLVTPMRHPHFCLHGKPSMLDLKYLIHDFEYMCRQLKPSSRTVFIDMGASLSFHNREGGMVPSFEVMDLYKKFGFFFDHVYAFELAYTKPDRVFKLVPKDMMASYHWINRGVTTDINSTLHPYSSIVSKFNEDDIVIVKLDIDTSSIEVPLAHQLLENQQWSKLIDQFYFEHHVFIKEMQRNWGQSMTGSIKDSIELFSNLRNKGIPAHFWV